MNNLLITYDHNLTGSTTIKVEVPGIPVRIAVSDFAASRVSLVLATPQRKSIQVGPSGGRGTHVLVKSVDQLEVTRFTLRSSRIFSMVSTSGGSVTQVAGDVSMIDQDPYLSLKVPRGSFLDMRDHGLVEVNRDGEVMTLEEAFSQGLLDVKFQNEL